MLAPNRAFLIVWLACATLPAQSEIAGVCWESDFGRALDRAGREGRPILLLEMVGRLDDALC